MKKTFIILNLLTSAYLTVRGQNNTKLDSFSVEGKYQGKNLYFSNPKKIVGRDTVWTAQKVYVNRKLILSTDSLKKDAFEVPLTKLSLQKGYIVLVKILQTTDNTVRAIQDMNCGPRKHKKKLQR